MKPLIELLLCHAVELRGAADAIARGREDWRCRRSEKELIPWNINVIKLELPNELVHRDLRIL